MKASPEHTMGIERPKKHFSTAALVCGGLFIATLAFAILGMALGLASIIKECECDDSQELEAQVDDLMASSSQELEQLRGMVRELQQNLSTTAIGLFEANQEIAELQQNVSSTAIGLFEANQEIAELQQNLSTTTIMLSETNREIAELTDKLSRNFSDTGGSNDSDVEEVSELCLNLTLATKQLVQEIANLSDSVDTQIRQLTEELDALSDTVLNLNTTTEDITYLGQCNTTQLASCTAPVDSTFVPGFSVCETPTVQVNTQGFHTVDVRCERTDGNPEVNPVIATLLTNILTGEARCLCYLVAPTMLIPPTETITCGMQVTQCPAVTQTVATR